MTAIWSSIRRKPPGGGFEQKSGETQRENLLRMHELTPPTNLQTGVWGWIYPNLQDAKMANAMIKGWESQGFEHGKCEEKLKKVKIFFGVLGWVCACFSIYLVCLVPFLTAFPLTLALELPCATLPAGLFDSKRSVMCK